MPLKTNEALRQQKIIGFAVKVRYAFSELDCRRNLNTPRTARKKKTYSNIPGYVSSSKISRPDVNLP